MEPLESAVLSLLMFPESFGSIVDECEIPSTKHIIGDVLKKLMHDELVMPLFDDGNGNYRRSLGYDSDFLDHYRYQITAKGLKKLQNLT